MATWPADYHLHTPLCRHATGAPTELAARALAVGLEEIGFSDHSPMRQDNFDDWRMRLDQLDEYVDTVRQAQRDHRSLAVKLALEVDYLPGHEDWIRDLAGRHAWDYLIGSVHYVSDSWAVDDPRRLSEWRARDAFEVWSVYFDRLTMAAQSRLFDILGHADLPKKFGFLPQRDVTPLVERWLEAVKAADVAVELNTAGWRKECRELYPAPRIVRLMRQHHIPITFGSDAHAVEEVGANFADAVTLARQAGYHHSCRFTRRRRDGVPL
jgi:histidinol-phosphatase (PHP family)